MSPPARCSVCAAGLPPQVAAEPQPAWVGRTWRLTVEGAPQPKQRARHDNARRGAAPRVEARTLNFEQRVAGAAIEAGVALPEGAAMRVHVDLWMPDHRSKDGDNILKAVLDGLRKAGKLVLPDDALAYVPGGGWWLAGYSPRRPRSEITITLVERVTTIDCEDAVGEAVDDDYLVEAYL